MQTQIRKALAKDIKHIAQIHVDSWQVAYKDLMPPTYIGSFDLKRRTQEWSNIIERDLAEVWLAENNSEIVGFCCFGQPKGYKNTNNFKLSCLYISPSQFAKGYGSLLQQKCDAILLEKAADKLFISALKGNQRAINFYQKHGFELTGIIEEEPLADTILVDLELVKEFKDKQKSSLGLR